MDIFTRFNNALAAFKKNSIDTNVGVDPNAFLKFGSRRMPSTWTTPEINDEDFYTGYGFAVVNKRANRSVTLGKKFLYTDAKDSIIQDANDKGVAVTHPYLDLIRNSTDFAERDFWYDISTYLDLEGIYYLMAVRTVAANKVGNIQKFVLLNPYWIRQVVNQQGDLGGYVENNPYLGQRVIAKEMIIPIRLLNPFDPTKAYSLADAARDSQFTLKQANDFARESINGNLNAPGILSSAIELPDDQFDNFVSRIKDHSRGEPLFGNGSGTVSWVDMQTDLDKAALDKINSISRDALLAVSGTSKSGMGVEEAGAGREVSRTQKDDFTENAVMPQIENIIDALNLDYRRYYSTDYAKNNYVICLDNPLETDREAEKADVDIRTSEFELLQTLLTAGYEYDVASKFAKGLITITDLGEPTNAPEPVVPTDTTPTGDGTDPNQPTDNSFIKIKSQLAARDIPDLYDGMNIDLENLGCIMLNTNIIPVTPYVEDYKNDVYDDGDHSGIVGEKEPHVTLLFGLLENGNTWKAKVDKVLEGWSLPTVTIDQVSAFDLGDSYAIVGLVEKTPGLVDGHERLTLLPHINTFSEYIPHITLAYVKHDEAIKDKWVNSLNSQYAGKEIGTKSINYGDLPVDNSHKEYDVYEGYPVPVLQYLGEHANQINPISEKGSLVYSTETMLQMNAAKKTVHISKIEDIDNALIGVVDNTTYIKLGEFRPNADKVAILSKLNKRYKNQPVAIKKKINLDSHDHNYLDLVKNAAFDKQAQISSNTNDLLTSAQAAEDSLFEWYLDNGKRPDSLDSFINSLTLPFAVYFTVMFPIYASHRIQQTAKDLDVTDLPIIAMTSEIKRTIDEFAKREATSHINTLNTDLQNALTIIKAQTSDPAEISILFNEAYQKIRTRRSQVIANSAASKIFNLSQYEADLQFLTRVGLVDNAYKVLFSLTGDPCQFCAHLIAESNANPIPFTQAFASLGQTLDIDGEKMHFDYENIIAGNVHPNCHCAYKLIIKN